MTRAPAPPSAPRLLSGEGAGEPAAIDRDRGEDPSFYAEAEGEAASALFTAMLARLSRRVSLFVFRGFFEPVVPLRLDDRLLTLAAPSGFHRDWLRDHYVDLLEDAAASVAGHKMRITLVHDERITGPSAPMPDIGAAAAAIAGPGAEAATPWETGPFGPGLRSAGADSTALGASSKQDKQERTASALRSAFEAGSTPAAHPGSNGAWPSSGSSPPSPAGPPPSGGEAGRVLPYRPKKEPQLARGVLNPRYTFDSFITGHSNRMAYASCQAVAEHPASKYSPLFLFGSTGLGKTHLLHAIGNALLQSHPRLRIVYMSAEEWVNEYIKEIRQQRFDDFRARYRGGCDILLLDDIQFLAGKDASQDEFFHTFNSLYASGRQIVVTSDRYPHEIEGLEERLKTRLQWGLIADVQPPEMETRVAILQQKADALGLTMTEELAHYLASHISRSVRELEGALHRLQAYAHLTGEVMTLERAREQLRGVVGVQAGAVTVDAIMRAVGAYYDVKPADMKSKSRQRQLTLARQVAMYLARKHLGASLPELGRAFGGRDHTTVLSSVRKVASLLATDAGMQAVVGRIERTLGGDL